MQRKRGRWKYRELVAGVPEPKLLKDGYSWGTLPKYEKISNHKQKGVEMKKALALIAVLMVASVIAGCSNADVASNNLSKAADQFELTRRIVFYNGITGDYILTIEGLCSLGNYDSPGELTVTCKTGVDAYKKHFLGLSDNVTYFAEQIDAAPTDVYHYRVIFKPKTIIPNLETINGN